MFKLRLAAAAAIACAVTLLSSGAQAYPDCGVSLKLSSSTLVGGKSFSFTADSGSVDCDWTVTYRGKTKTGSGTSISGSYSTPVVTKKSTSEIKATCEQAAFGASAAPATTSSTVTPAFYSAESSAVLPAATTTSCPVDATVTLLPKGGVDDEGDGALPDTGGSNLWLLLLGGALVTGGAGVTYAAQRRKSSH